jgi:hypothetical protein
MSDDRCVRAALVDAIQALEDAERGVPGHVRALNAIGRARAALRGQKYTPVSIQYRLWLSDGS